MTKNVKINNNNLSNHYWVLATIPVYNHLPISHRQVIDDGCILNRLVVKGRRVVSVENLLPQTVKLLNIIIIINNDNGNKYSTKL